ncbi:MAG: hypothetical protein NXI31_16295 [bacterium]|nr:hypothetical protein [bacterium]
MFHSPLPRAFSLLLMLAVALPSQSATKFEDGEITSSRRELLEFAFEATILMPGKTHGVDRCMMQEDIALACIEHDQLALAHACAKRISGWRRGVVQAVLGIEAAELFRVAAAGDDDENGAGYRELANRYLELALRQADGVQRDPTGQAWQRDRIRARAAIGYQKLGQLDDAVQAANGLDAAESANWESTVAATLDDAAFDAQIQALDTAIKVADMQQAMNASRIAVVLYGRYYEDEKRRARVLDRLERMQGLMPRMAGLGHVGELAEAAAEHGDARTAKRWIAQMREQMAGVRVHEEDRMKFRARLARLLDRAGARSEALDELNETLQYFEVHKQEIETMFRADGLAPVGNAYERCGSRASAVAVYRLALEHAAINPNSRPRLQDLVLVALSMIDCGFEPPPTLRQRMQKMRAGLGEPW